VRAVEERPFEGRVKSKSRTNAALKAPPYASTHKGVFAQDTFGFPLSPKVREKWGTQLLTGVRLRGTLGER